MRLPMANAGSAAAAGSAVVIVNCRSRSITTGSVVAWAGSLGTAARVRSGDDGGVTALILWDVDLTLVATGPVGWRTYQRVFAERLGVRLSAAPDMAGRTDFAITRELLRLHGASADDAAVALVLAAMGSAAAAIPGADFVATRGVLPGAAEAVAALGEAGAVQSVVTGNVPAMASAKLAAFGLTDRLDLDIGGYGHESHDRAELVRSAIARAAVKHGPAIRPDATVVIGDTPHDVRGAHDCGAFAVAVATGRYAFGALAESGADLVLADLTDSAPLLDLVATVHSDSSAGRRSAAGRTAGAQQSRADAGYRTPAEVATTWQDPPDRQATAT
jgi:phosphoglycolate phosphatase